MTTSSALCSGDQTSVCSTTDGRGFTKIYSYDSANRLIQVTHSPGTVGDRWYTFGNNTAQYNVGRLVTMTDPSGSENYSYDNIGRLVNMSKVIGGTAYNVGYQYNAAGDLTKLTYPSGRIVQYSYDAVGHLCAVAPSTSSCSTHTNPYLTISSSDYDPAGHPLFATYGNGVVATSSYTPARSQLATVSYSKGFYFGLQYWYQNDSTNCPQGSAGNNGQIQCITDNEPGRSLRYTYDALGRLATANTTGDAAYPAWGLSETYDRFGNKRTHVFSRHKFCQ